MTRVLSFKQWLYAQSERHDPIGDLSKDTIATEQLVKDPNYCRARGYVPEFPKPFTLGMLKKAIRQWSGIPEALQAADAAYAEFKKTLLRVEDFYQAE
jgi:hypothetical protein